MADDRTTGGLRVWLVVRTGGCERIVEVTGERFTIGSDPTCDLVLEDPAASPRHAEIRLVPGRPPEVADLDSSTGTLVNDAPLRRMIGFGTTEAITPLADRDVIRCGETLLRASFVDPRTRL